MTNPAPDLWIKSFQRNAFARVRLFCFGCAGGSASAFREWSRHLPEAEVLAIQLPGRGPRFDEPPRTDLSGMVRDLAEAMRPFLDRPFALFGHSLGGLLAFESARHLRCLGASEPGHLFTACMRAPHLPPEEPLAHALPDDEFLANLTTLGGTPPAILAHDELVRMLVPALRADFALHETYQHQKQRPLACPLSVFGGAQDRMVARESLEAWSSHTSGPSRVQIFEGDHFFFYTQPQQRRMLEAIGYALRGMEG
jgi:medium-chain acyl-[acyl-carrier-protein] hydrolase